MNCGLFSEPVVKIIFQKPLDWRWGVIDVNYISNAGDTKLFISHKAAKNQWLEYISKKLLQCFMAYLLILQESLRPTPSQLLPNSTLKDLLSYPLMEDQLPSSTYQFLLNLTDDKTPVTRCLDI